MNISIHMISETVEKLDIQSGDKKTVHENLKHAEDALQRALCNMDEFSVQGRNAVDALFGCMMAVEAIIGENPENG